MGNDAQQKILAETNPSYPKTMTKAMTLAVEEERYWSENLMRIIPKERTLNDRFLFISQAKTYRTY